MPANLANFFFWYKSQLKIITFIPAVWNFMRPSPCPNFNRITCDRTLLYLKVWPQVFFPKILVEFMHLVAAKFQHLVMEILVVSVDETVGEFVDAQRLEARAGQLYATCAECDIAGGGVVHCRVVPQCLYNSAFAVWDIYAFRYFLQYLWYDLLCTLVNDFLYFPEYSFLYVDIVEVGALGEHDVATVAIETGVVAVTLSSCDKKAEVVGVEGIAVEEPVQAVACPLPI